MNLNCAKKNACKLFSFLLAIVLLSLYVMPAKATTERASFYIESCGAEIITHSRGNIDITFTITGTHRLDQIGATCIYLYEDDGNGFELIKTFRQTNDKYSYLLGKNTIRYTESVPYEGISGNDYYAVVLFLAADESGEDTDRIETSIVTAH